MLYASISTETSKISPKLFVLCKHILSHLAIISLLFNQFFLANKASAQDLPITADGSTNTQITKTASGIDQINIAAPGASGISHNKFNDYNINTAGQIINNFSGSNSAEIAIGSGSNAATQTQIAGLVSANPNLSSSGSARIILNEVTSGNVSKLLGYIEIAGSKADLILANPNGITCAGCGFINTSHLLMVAGSSNFDGNGHLGFNLKEQSNPNFYAPLITVDGLGLDATRTSATEIIASSVKLISSIYGNENGSVVIKTGEGSVQQSSIVGDWQIDPKDQSKQGTEISSVNSENSPIFAIDASSLAKIQAGQIFLIATKEGVGVKMDGEILAAKQVNIDVNGDVYYAKISSENEVNINSAQSLQSIDDNSTISTPSLTIQANAFNHLGKMLADDLTIHNSKNLTNSGNIEALNLNLQNVGSINNSGLIYGKDSFKISSIDLNNSASIYSGNDLDIAADSLVNSNSIYSSKNLNFDLNSSLINSGEVSAFENLSINGKSEISNSSRILSNNDLNINGNILVNDSTAIIASLAKSLNLALNNSLLNEGELNSAIDLTINSKSLNNIGNVYSKNHLDIINGDNLDNSGIIYSDNILSIKADSLTNSATIQSFGDSEITATNTLTNKENSIIYSGKNLNITANSSLINLGEISAIDSAVFNAFSVINSKDILSNNNIAISSSEIDNKKDGIIASIDKSIVIKPY